MSLLSFSPPRSHENATRKKKKKNPETCCLETYTGLKLVAASFSGQELAAAGVWQYPEEKRREQEALQACYSGLRAWGTEASSLGLAGCWATSKWRSVTFDLAGSLSVPAWHETYNSRSAISVCCFLHNQCHGLEEDTWGEDEDEAWT